MGVPTSRDGDWDAWTSFFAQGVAASAAESQRKVERLVQLQQEFRRRVQRAGRRGASERLAADLVGTPYVARNTVADRYGLSGQGARNAIGVLDTLGILVPTDLRNISGAQMFVCDEVVKVVSS